MFPENECEFTYSGLDSDGNATFIRYDGKNLKEMGKFERSGFVRDNVSYSFCHPKEKYYCSYDGKISKITTITSSYDSQTNQIIGKTIQIRDFDNPNKSVCKESYKYEYKYDSKGNWIEKIEKKEVTKFGETYFEPIFFTERQIRYYSDPDTKPSVNKKSTVKRKKN